MNIKANIKKVGSKVKGAGSFVKRHKKAIALSAGALALGTAGAMYTGYLPTPELVQSAVQLASQTVAEHPTEALIAGSAVGGAVGAYALKKVYKGTKTAYRAVKAVKVSDLNPKKIAEQAVSKAKELISKGGEQTSQTAKVDFDKAKWFITET